MQGYDMLQRLRAARVSFYCTTRGHLSVITNRLSLQWPSALAVLLTRLPVKAHLKL